MATALTIVFAFAIGASVASFLNVVADRLPRGQSLMRPGSHCPNCKHELRAHELIPILSFLLLRGRCSQCGSRIGVRTPVVEAAGGVAFAFPVYEYGVGLDSGLMALAFAFLLLIVIIDMEHRLILDKVNAVALPVALVSSTLWSDAVRDALWWDGESLEMLGRFLEAVAGAVVGFGVLYLVAAGAMLLRGSEGIGGGDVKFAAVIGAWAGLRLVGVALMVSVVLGGIIAIGLIIARISGRKDLMPFGPFLCLGTALTLVYGFTIWDWYLRLLTP